MRADADLLAAFQARRCEEAFAEIVARHGAMVLRACLRSLGDVQESEDAAQAAFLMLAQRPRAVPGSLATWLYFAARKTAYVARRSRQRRVHREEAAAMQAVSSANNDPELREEIDAALERLPEPLREAVILCHLEGRDQSDAARQAGCSQATISRRSSEGLQQLRDILVRRGTPIAGVTLVALLTGEASAAVPLAPLSASQLLAGAARPQAAQLAQAAWRSLFWTQVKVKVAALTVGLVTTATVGLAIVLQTRTAPTPVVSITPPPALPLVRERAVFDHSDRVICVAFAPDGKTLASGSADQRIQLYNVHTRQLMATLSGHRFPIKCVAFSADGATLASADVRGEVKLWHTADGSERTTLRTSSAVHSLAFAPDGRTLAIGFSRGHIDLWDLQTRQRRAVLKGHTDMVHCQAFSADGRLLASGSRDRTVRLWDVATAVEQFRLAGPEHAVCAVAFAPDGKTLAAGSGRSLEEVWSAMTVVPGGSPSGAVTIWDTATGRRAATLPIHVAGIYSLAYSPDGKVLALGRGDALVALWDLTTQRELTTLQGHQALVRSLVFSPDGQTLASASHDLTVRLWDFAAPR